jgi:hypothetical protein
MTWFMTALLGTVFVSSLLYHIGAEYRSKK